MARVCVAASIGVLVTAVGHPSAVLDFLFVDTAVHAQLLTESKIENAGVHGSFLLQCCWFVCLLCLCCVVLPVSVASCCC